MKRNPKPRYQRKTLSKTKATPTGDIKRDTEALVENIVTPTQLGGKEEAQRNIDIYMAEWSMFYPQHTLKQYLMEVKGLNANQYANIMHNTHIDDWQRFREKIQNKLTETVVKRHIDRIAEAQETHISASKLGLAKSIKMLSDGGITMLDKKTGLPKTNKKGEVIVFPMRSIDLVNCMSAVEKCQQVYRRALGLPNEEGGLAQVLDKIEHMQAKNVQNNLHIHVEEAAQKEKQALHELSYEDVMALVEFRRAQKKQLEAAEEKPAEHVVPKEGDFTALPLMGKRT